MNDSQLEEVARLFGVLSEVSRLRLLRCLMDGPETVGNLVAATGMKQGNVSKHLRILQDARFVRGLREGNFVRYEICDERLRALCELMCRRVEQTAKAWADEVG